MTGLLDVNALIALIDSDHVDHSTMEAWFLRQHHAGWATCPLTENGVIRVLSQPTYPSGQRTPAEVVQILAALKNAFRSTYSFWADGLSLIDDGIFDAAMIVSSRQVTDVYLLGLVRHHEATLVSFDRSLAWQAIRGGSKALVHLPRS